MTFNEIYNLAIAEATKAVTANQFLSGGLTLGIIGGLIAWGRRLPMKLWAYLVYHFTITLTVREQDEAFRMVMRWLANQRYASKARRLELMHVSQNSLGYRQQRLVPALGSHWFFWHYRPVWLDRAKTEKTGESGNTLPSEDITIRTLGRTQKIISELLAEARESWWVTVQSKTNIYEWAHGSWIHSAVAPRLLKTVYLPDEGLDILEDIKSFFSKQTWYQHRGIPFRRGYLLHGPPGGGKSVTAAALADELKLPLMAVNLGAVYSDNELGDMFRKLRERCILLLEDIDTAAPTREKNDEGVTLGALLNCLDGVLGREDLIIIMTTNHREKLDEALIRPGRIDRQIFFGPATNRQIGEAIRVMCPELKQAAAVASASWPRPIMMAEVQEKLRQFAFEGAKHDPPTVPTPDRQSHRRPSHADLRGAFADYSTDDDGNPEILPPPDDRTGSSQPAAR